MPRREIAADLGVAESTLRTLEDRVLPEYGTVPDADYVLAAEFYFAAVGKGTPLSPQRAGAAWEQLLTRKERQMGQAVSVAGDGTIVGAPQSPAFVEIRRRMADKQRDRVARGAAALSDAEAYQLVLAEDPALYDMQRADYTSGSAFLKAQAAWVASLKPGPEGSGARPANKTLDEIERLADEKQRGDPKLSRTAARNAVFSEQPSLYDVYRRETTTHVKGAE